MELGVGHALFLFALVNVAHSQLEDVTIDRYAIPTHCPREVRAWDYVRYHYNGSLAGGRKFESSLDRGFPFVGQVGAESKVIPGLDRGVLGMCVNEVRGITVPPHLAYGVLGAGLAIPPDSVLLFEVHLLDLWNKEDTVDIRIVHQPQTCKRKVQSSDFVRYHYNGSLLLGTMFESSGMKKTFETYVGQDSLIPGLVKGLLGMCVGERRSIIIPPFLAYDDRGYGSKIPPHATLVFEVLMVDVFNVNDVLMVEDGEIPQPCRRKSAPGDFIRYHYNGSFQDGTVFDSSYYRNSTYDTVIGTGSVIAGVDQALRGLCVGQRRRVTVPPHLAYGEQGSGKLIPGSAVLVFDLHVVDFHNPKDTLDIRVTYKSANCSPTSSANDMIQYRYNCSLLDGTRLYSSDDYPDTPRVILGQGNLISGLDEGLQGMCLFERREITVPPHLAHGASGGVGVPGSAVLLFELELLRLDQGVPEGFLFVWLDKSPDPLFSDFDANQDQEIVMEEFASFVKLQVAQGRGRFHPGMDTDVIIKEIFRGQDKNQDNRITEKELSIVTNKVEEEVTKREEL